MKLTENFTLIKCIAEIRNNETGEIREFETDEILVIGGKIPIYIYLGKTGIMPVIAIGSFSKGQKMMNPLGR